MEQLFNTITAVALSQPVSQISKSTIAMNGKNNYPVSLG
jgi:hypothetical protein